ncbi:Pectate lyase [Rhynchospora pubera]|uniref:Pectate lyase n=1 Tax=Rhynchospora pubera TaxID=906938 RepID=A0AAV8DL11_9POAL|nr:Pectate lyase [Rhynchospora pubera]KAJ4782247.1 Pectate lyase [Rhynchospora pubera]KAJ4789162.1 Pectate lyase [Rhynchospora pubera]KAJ4808669.1 Pectate lyase [Rhynchospora pubera]
MEGLKLSKATKFFLISAIFMASAMFATADDGEVDSYWENLAASAEARAKSAYNPNPVATTNSFNKDVHRILEEDEAEPEIELELESGSESNYTRRSLKQKYKGPCLATNPIDRCWRCRANWASDRKRLATCVKGFASGTTGGAAGRIYVVTDPTDKDVINPKKGTLRWGVIQKEPLWITFANDMIIMLSQELMISSNKTIDGRGANVRIAYGAQITIQFAHNVIIHNIHIHDIKPASGGMVRDSTDHFGIRGESDGDGITIFGSTNVWIDHVSMSNCADGLIDVVQRSTAITISNGHYTRHNDVMLFGASDSYSDDQYMQVTLAFNHFGRGLVQRMPRCRWGFFHVVNNDYTHWLMYAVGGSKNPTIISQGNRYIAPPNLSAKEVTKREYASEGEWKNWVWKSQGDLLRNGANFTQSGGQNERKYTKEQFFKAKPGTFVTRLTRFSGTLDCQVGKKC